MQIRRVLSRFSAFFGALSISLALSGCGFFRETPPEAALISYYIKEGDTLYSIAMRHGVTVAEVERYNSIDDPRYLELGSKILIPDRGDDTPRASVKLAPKKTKNQFRLLPQSKKWIGKLEFPIKGGNLSSKFGNRWSSFHEGVDIRSPEGTPIYAAHSGTVVYSGQSLRNYGKLIAIEADGIMTIYAHNSRNRVSHGDTVTRGERIADVGETGKATGPHLHFEVRVPNSEGKHVAVDPLKFYRF